MLNKKPGLTDILIGHKLLSLSDISNVVQKTHIPNLFFISSGVQVPNPSELIGSQRMIKIVEMLSSKFSIVLFDSPPVDSISDTHVLNNYIHNLIFVVRYGKTSLNNLQKKIAEYSALAKDIKGIVINASHKLTEERYYNQSYYHY